MITIQTNCCSSRQAEIFEEKLNFWSKCQGLAWAPPTCAVCTPLRLFHVLSLKRLCLVYFPSIWGSPHIGQMSEPCSCLCFVWPLFTSFFHFFHVLFQTGLLPLFDWSSELILESARIMMIGQMSGIWSSVWNMMIGQMSGSLRALGWFITIKYSPPLVSFVIQTCALPGSGVSAANFSVRSITVNTVQIQYSQVCFQLYQIVPRPCRWLTDYKTTRPFWNTQSLKRDV